MKRELNFDEDADYETLIESLGHTILVSVADNEYQGDTRTILINPNGRIGFLIFGWGSCSGCDALQGCYTLQDLVDLRSSLENSIEWFDTTKECLTYLLEKDWSGSFLEDSTNKEFVKRASIALISRKLDETVDESLVRKPDVD